MEVARIIWGLFSVDLNQDSDHLISVKEGMESEKQLHLLARVLMNCFMLISLTVRLLFWWIGWLYGGQYWMACLSVMSCKMSFLGTLHLWNKWNKVDTWKFCKVRDLINSGISSECWQEVRTYMLMNNVTYWCSTLLFLLFL